MTRGRLWIVAGGIVVIGAGALSAAALTGRLAPSRPAASTSPGSVVNVATVVRHTLTSQLAVSGTLGYSGSYVVINDAEGHWTSLPAVGQVISQGQTIYSIDGAPVVLLYGTTPAYRDFRLGMSDGRDVIELEEDLLALGYANSSNLVASGHFDSFDVAAIKRWQKAMGLSQTGVIGLGQVVFLPGSIRITSVQPVLGSPAQPGQAVAAATSTARHVVVQLNADQQASVKAGDAVTITLPNNQTTAGTVTFIGTVATTPSGSGNGAGSTPTVEVDITPTDAAATGTLDAAPVEVYITTASVDNALAVPVTALLAIAGGGYDVEVVDASGHHHLVPVTLGLFDDADGLVQVTGSGIAAGEEVVVAGT